MFIDASAIVAIIARELGHEELDNALNAVDAPLYISPLVKFEASVSLARQTAGQHRRKPSASDIKAMTAIVDAFIEDFGVQELAISAEIGDAALAAAATYGKIVGHPANLNFGDCYAYACAKHLGVKLLYKGNDFAKTDLA